MEEKVEAVEAKSEKSPMEMDLRKSFLFCLHRLHSGFQTCDPISEQEQFLTYYHNMTKGEKYRAYYLKNRERILAANTERNRMRREATANDGDAIAERRHKERESYTKRRAAYMKQVLTDKAEEPDSHFFVTLANQPHLHEITKRQLDWLLRCVPACEIKPTLVIEEIDGTTNTNTITRSKTPCDREEETRS